MRAMAAAAARAAAAAARAAVVHRPLLPLSLRPAIRLALHHQPRLEVSSGSGDAGSGSGSDFQWPEYEMGSGGCWGELIGEDEEAEEPEALAELMDGLFTFFIAFPTVLALQLWAFWYWRYRMNRGYYDELYLPQEVWDPKKAKIEAEGKFRRKYFGLGPKVPIVVKKPRKKMFIALFGPFVFPAFPILAINFFQTGMVENGWALILECYKRSDTEEFALANETMFTCIMPGILTISFVMCNMTLCCAMLWWFNINFRKASWEPLAAPTDAESIEDPLFRLITKVRYNVLAKIPGYKRFILGPMWDRPRGEFMRPWDEVEEPARTERLLANPVHHLQDQLGRRDRLAQIAQHGPSERLPLPRHLLRLLRDRCTVDGRDDRRLGSLFIPQTPGAYGQMIAIITVQWGSCSTLASRSRRSIASTRSSRRFSLVWRA